MYFSSPRLRAKDKFISFFQDSRRSGSQYKSRRLYAPYAVPLTSTSLLIRSSHPFTGSSPDRPASINWPRSIESKTSTLSQFNFAGAPLTISRASGYIYHSSLSSLRSRNWHRLRLWLCQRHLAIGNFFIHTRYLPGTPCLRLFDFSSLLTSVSRLVATPSKWTEPHINLYQRSNKSKMAAKITSQYDTQDEYKTATRAKLHLAEPLKHRYKPVIPPKHISKGCQSNLLPCHMTCAWS